MVIAVDKSALKKEYRDAEIEQMLVNFADLVSFAKPCCNYVVDDNCVDREWTTDEQNNSIAKHYIRRLKVFENGEELGDICIGRRYGRGSSEMVYKVRSFRINKERGDRNGVMAKDIKVALRHAKKVLVSRESAELIKQVKERITQFLDYHTSNLEHRLTWSINSNATVVDLSIRAYQARQEGKTEMTVPATVNTNSLKQHDEACSKYLASKSLSDAMKDKKGYGVFARIDNSLIVYSFATDTVKRYASFDELPEHIQNKYAMFKVLEKDEAVANFGCKFDDGYTYVVE